MAFVAEFLPAIAEMFGATGATVGAEAMGAGIVGGGAADIAAVEGTGMLGGLEAAGAGGLAAGLEGAGSAMGGMGSLFSGGAKAGTMLGGLQTLSGIYGLTESERLRRKMRPPNPGQLTSMPGYQAGLEAVQRSMAAQGYQGSGNMMAALSQYGGQSYNDFWQNSMQSAAMEGNMFSGGTMGSMGLIAGGMPKLFGWGSSGGK